MGGGFIEALITIWMDLGLPWTSMTPLYITLIGAGVLLPFFLRNIRIAQARNLLKRSNSIYHQERRDMEQLAIAKVQDIPVALLGLADQAIAMKRTQLAEDILQHVPNTKKYRSEKRRIAQRIAPTSSLDHWVQIQKVQNLIAQEMWDAAKIQRLKIPETHSEEEEVIWIDQQLALRS